MKTLVLVAILLVLAPAGATAQNANPNAPLTTEEQMLMFFPTVEACKAAYESGKFLGYVPHPNNLKKPPVGAVELPTPICADEDVREFSGGKRAWTIHLNPFVTLNDKGDPDFDARCINRIHASVRLPLRRGPQGPAGPMGPQGPKGDKGDRGEAGRTPLLKSCPDGSTTLSNLACPEPRQAEESEGLDLDWGITGAGYVTALSESMANHAVRSLSDMDNCKLEKGAMADFGIFVNFNEWLGVRGLATWKNIRGTTQRICPDGCVASVQETDGLQAWGVRGDLMLTIPLTERLGLRGTLGLQREKYNGRTVVYYGGRAPGRTGSAEDFLGTGGTYHAVLGAEVPIRIGETFSVAPAFSYGFPQGASIGVRLDKKF